MYRQLSDSFKNGRVYCSKKWNECDHSCGLFHLGQPKARVVVKFSFDFDLGSANGSMNGSSKKGRRASLKTRRAVGVKPLDLPSPANIITTTANHSLTVPISDGGSVSPNGSVSLLLPSSATTSSASVSPSQMSDSSGASRASRVTLEDIIASARRKISKDYDDIQIPASSYVEVDGEVEMEVRAPLEPHKRSYVNSPWPQHPGGGGGKDAASTATVNGGSLESGSKGTVSSSSNGTTANGLLSSFDSLNLHTPFDYSSGEEEEEDGDGLWQKTREKPPPNLYYYYGDEEQEDLDELLSAPPKDAYSNPTISKGADPLTKRSKRAGDHDDGEDASSIDLSIADMSGSMSGSQSNLRYMLPSAFHKLSDEQLLSVQIDSNASANLNK